MDFFIQDCKGFFLDPKGTFKRIATYDSLTIPGVILFICGIILGVKRYLMGLKTLASVLPKELTPYNWGMKDADSVLAMLTPFAVLACWFACSFIAHFSAERLGAIKGELQEVLMASGYLSYPLLAYLIITFPIFYLGEVMRVPALGFINGAIGLVFAVWMFFLMCQLIESLCEMPMSHSGIAVGITFFIVFLVYYPVDLILKHFLAQFFGGKYV
ncbi:MAG: YIP1 family protein [Candidatus Xenobiia bacterium LiM19]